MKVNILIGEMIQKEVYELNMSLQEISERVHIQKKDLLLLFKKKNMDTHVLYKWSCLLGVDFFSNYSEYLKKNNYIDSYENNQDKIIMLD